MSKIYFSEDISRFVEPKKSGFKELFYQLFQKPKEDEVKRIYIPDVETLESVFEETPEVKSFCYISSGIQDGLLFIEYACSIRAEILNDISNETVAYEILQRLVSAMQKKLGVHIVGYIPTLTSRNIVIAIAVSKTGLRTIRQLQIEQKKAEYKQVLKDAVHEERVARATRDHAKHL